MQRPSIVAIGAGIATDLWLSLVCVIPLFIGVYATPELQGLTPDAQTQAIMPTIAGSSRLGLLAQVLGALASICGGWVAATIAKRDELLHGALSAVGCMLLGVQGWIAGTSTLSAWAHVGFLVLSPLLGLAGGALRWRSVRAASLRGAAEPRPAVTSAFLWWNYASIVLCIGILIVLASYMAATRTGVSHDTTLGLALIGVYVVLLAAALAVAVRGLRTTHRRRWVRQGVALVMTVLPVLLIALT